MSRNFYDMSMSPYTRIDGLMEYLCCGRNTAMRIGIDSGAKKKLGKIVVYDLRKIDAYMDTLDCNESDPDSSTPDIDVVIAETKKARADYNQHRS